MNSTTELIVDNSNHVFVNLSILLLSKIANLLDNHDKMTLAFVCKRWMASIDKIVISFKLNNRLKITKDLNNLKSSSMILFRNLFINSLLKKESISLYINESKFENYNANLNDYTIINLDNVKIESHVNQIFFGSNIPDSYMISFHSFIEKNPNINEIILEHGFYHTIRPNSIPKQIKRLVLSYGVNVKDGSLPESLEILSIISREKQISNNVIPKSLRKLYIEGDISQIDHLPSSLENLTLYPIGKFNIDTISLPHTLREVYIPGFLVPKLKNMPLLKVLGIVGERYPKEKPLPFKMTDIPPSVTTLDFLTDIFNIPNGIFPPTLKNLNLGECSYDLTKIKGLVPFFVENAHFNNLSMGKRLRELKDNQLPSSVKSLVIVNDEYPIKYHTGCFPISLGMEKLSLTCPKDNIIGLIPNTVKELSITFPGTIGFRPIVPGEIPDSVETLTLRNLDRIDENISIPSSVKKLVFKVDLEFRENVPETIKWIEEYLPKSINNVYIDDLCEMKRLYDDQFILLRANFFGFRYNGKFNNGIVSLNKLSKYL